MPPPFQWRKSIPVRTWALSSVLPSRPGGRSVTADLSLPRLGLPGAPGSCLWSLCRFLQGWDCTGPQGPPSQSGRKLSPLFSPGKSPQGQLPFLCILASTKDNKKLDFQAYFAYCSTETPEAGLPICFEGLWKFRKNAYELMLLKWSCHKVRGLCNQ